MSFRARLLAVAVLVTAGAQGCAGAPVRRIGLAGPGDPAWPRDNGEVIAYAGEIRTPENVGIEYSFFQRLWRAIAGVNQTDELSHPYGVALSPDGRIAIADPGKKRVHLYAPASQEYQRLTFTPEGQLQYPVAVAFAQEVLLVADAEAARLFAYDRKGQAVPLPFQAPAFERPSGLAVDLPRGRVYVSDTAANRVWVLPLGGGEARSFGTRGKQPGEFNFPTHLAVDGEGRIYVCDAMNFRVQVFDPELQPLRSFGQLGDGPGDFSKPKGLAVDGEGNVFVVEGLFDVVQVFNPDGQLLGFFGGSGSGPGRFWLPGGLALDARGLLYVADSYNGRVQVFDLHRKASP